MRLSIKILPGVRISGSTRRRGSKGRAKAKSSAKTKSSGFAHVGCGVNHRSQAAAERCAKKSNGRTPSERSSGGIVYRDHEDEARVERMARMSALAYEHRPPPEAGFYHPFEGDEAS
jgi:hypothetical protein